jgi:hypothetical protein
MGAVKKALAGENPFEGNIVPEVHNPFHSSETVWLPGAGGLNPLNSQSAVGQLTKDLGSLNPMNPDTVAFKVIDNIGRDMARDPAKWIAITAAVAAGQFQLIPYINAVATVTSKNSTPEEWLTEGVKAYAISAGGEWVANNVTGVGPQTDITTGETFAGTGASGAAGSAQVGAVAGNISRNIFATAARQGTTDINSAQIVTGAITSEALNEAFKYMPGFDKLDKSDQTLAVNAFKVAFNKDSNAAYQMFNQGFDATIKGLNDAAKSLGYADLKQQNEVNNFVQNQGSTEDIDALNKLEQSIQGKYDKYIDLQNKQDTYDKASKTYDLNLTNYNAALAQAAEWGNRGTWGGRMREAMDRATANQYYQPILAQAKKDMENNRVQPEILQQANSEYINTRALGVNNIIQARTYINEGWDNLAQQKEASQYGYTTPAAYKESLGGYSNLDQKTAAEDGGFTDVKTFKEADKLGFTNAGEYQAALDGNFKDAATYRDAKSLGTSNSADYKAIKDGGFDDLNELTAARKGNFTKASDYEAAQAVGIATLDNYQKFVKGAFTDAGMFNDASARGFTNAGDYAAARIAGWETKDEMDEAARLKIENPVSYRLYKVDESAKLEGYTSDAQRQAAQEGGFPNAATFKVADAAGFTNNDEFLKASTGGFNNATDYRDAKNLGIDNADLYTHYKGSGFPATLDYTNAAAKGFYTKAEFDDATTKGYTDKTTYDKGEGLGFKNANDYSVATANNIDAKTWNANNQKAVDEGWNHYADKLNAEKLGFNDPEMWKYATAVDLENQGSDITKNYLASQLTQVGEDLFYLPENAGIYNKSTGDVTDFKGNKLPADLFKGIVSNIKNVVDNPFVNRVTTTPTTKTTPTDALSQAAQVIPDYLQDPSQIAKRKERGTPYSTNPEWSVLNPQAPTTQQTQPQQKPQPLALPNPEVVQSGLFSGILSPYNPQQGGPYG